MLFYRNTIVIVHKACQKKKKKRKKREKREKEKEKIIKKAYVFFKSTIFLNKT